jgi:phosphopantetheinyl transferase
MKPDWKQTDPELILSPDYIDLWKVDLKSEDRNIFMHAQFLTSDEHARAGKYVNGKKSREFIITRSVLRNVLGHTLNENPKYLDIAYTRLGMPVLSPPDLDIPVSFSTFHIHMTLHS